MRGCNVRNMNPEKSEALSPELQRALEPLLAAIEELSERLRSRSSTSARRLPSRWGRQFGIKLHIELQACDSEICGFIGSADADDDLT